MGLTFGARVASLRAAGGVPIQALTPASCSSPFAGGPLPSASGPMAIAVDSPRTRLYVVHRASYLDVAAYLGLPSDSVSVVDQSTGALITAIPVGRALEGSHQGIAISPSDGTVFVPNADDDTVSVIDEATNTVVATTPVGKNPVGAAADPSRGVVYITNSGGGTVSILASSTGAVIATVATAFGGTTFQSPLNVAVDSSTHYAYVLAYGPPYTILVTTSRRARWWRGSICRRSCYRLSRGLSSC